jgi:lipopolysaccharide export system protein LptC
MKRIQRLFGVMILLFTAVLFSQCRQVDKKEIEKLNNLAEDLSVEKATNVTIRYTDSAILKVVINTPLLVRYPKKKEPYSEMPLGLNAKFYDKQGNADSHLSSNYGINYEDKKLIELRDSVRVVNNIGEELKSEELFWDQEKKIIYTNKFVKIVRDGEEIRGDGFESNENFTKYKILKPVGKLKVKENPIENESEKDS